MLSAINIEDHHHSHGQNRFAVIPTPMRLAALTEFTGQGVTIAFLDAGFYPHPDLTMPHHRILAFHDVTEPAAQLTDAVPSPAWAWHGTQTSVVAAGNGQLADGLYRGLAADATLVLVKVSERGRITDEMIVRGLEWVIAHKDVYNIRIVNLSLGGDADVALRDSLVDQAAERAVQAGLVLVVAAGNSGCSERPRPLPPANAPSVITVGGFDDFNQLNNTAPGLYCSNYGPTLDGLVKPEVLAPAIWVAAPLLPGTAAYQRATALAQLAAAPDYELPKLVTEYASIIALPPALAVTAAVTAAEDLRAWVEAELRADRLVATHYQHVDGTSFAAPIVASVVAQMLEANPRLSPALVKHLLIATADRLSEQMLWRQGYGVINAQRAVMAAQSEAHTDAPYAFNPPRVEAGQLVFWFHHDTAESVALAADFNGWEATRDLFARQASGLWVLRTAVPAPGTYRYKLVVNQTQWLDDPSHGLKEPDAYGGFNSLLHLSPR